MSVATEEFEEFSFQFRHLFLVRTELGRILDVKQTVAHVIHMPKQSNLMANM